MNSQNWINHFKLSSETKRVDWSLSPSITHDEVETIYKSVQAWQLGETSDGKNLLAATTNYAFKINDLQYVEAVKLFILEEQKHGNNLGRYLDMIGKPKIKKNWGDSLFRKIRYFQTSMEIWTLAVITVESTAQIFYQALKNATNCKLLQQICTDILIDEAYHINFQTERFAVIYGSKKHSTKVIFKLGYGIFYFCTAVVVWFAHSKLFIAGGYSFKGYLKRMHLKFKKTIMAATEEKVQFNSSLSNIFSE